MSDRVHPLRALKARAEARATLFFRDLEYHDLEEAIAPLRAYALNSGLVDDHGAAGCLAIIYAAFGLPANGDVSNHPRIEKIPS